MACCRFHVCVLGECSLVSLSDFHRRRKHGSGLSHVDTFLCCPCLPVALQCLGRTEGGAAVLRSSKSSDSHSGKIIFFKKLFFFLYIIMLVYLLTTLSYLKYFSVARCSWYMQYFLNQWSTDLENEVRVLNLFKF